MFSIGQWHLDDFPFHELDDAVNIFRAADDFEETLRADELPFHDHGDSRL